MDMLNRFRMRVRGVARALSAGRWALLAIATHGGILPRLSAQTLDAFDPVPQAPPATVALQADGKILVGGFFLDVASGTFFGVQRFNRDGSPDAGFIASEFSDDVKALAVQDDGKILVGGSFSAIAGQPRHFLARLNPGGSLDADFVDTGVDAPVWAIAVQPDGKVLVAGDFQNAGATPRAYAARFTTTGALDASFADPQICCGPARAIALQPNGSVLVGGYFLGVTGNSSIGSIARFSATGTLDAAFPVNPSATNVNTIVVAPDGSIYVGSSYATSDDQSLRPVAKLSANGTLDVAYADVHSDSGTNTLGLQPNGKMLFGGPFQSIDGQPRHALARLNANGSLDPAFADLAFSFSIDDPNGSLFGLALQVDGKAVAIGNFMLADGQPRTFAARVQTSDVAVSTLSGQASGSSVVVTWTRSGNGPELAQPPILMHSVDGLSYTVAGPMARIATGWQATAPYDVAGAPFRLQAMGVSSDGAGNGSLGRVASPVYVSDRIFADGFD